MDSETFVFDIFSQLTEKLTEKQRNNIAKLKYISVNIRYPLTSQSRFPLSTICKLDGFEKSVIISSVLRYECHEGFCFPTSYNVVPNSNVSEGIHVHVPISSSSCTLTH